MNFTELAVDQRQAISAALLALNMRVLDAEWKMHSLKNAIATYQRNQGTDAERRTASALLLALHRCQPQPGLPPADKPAPKPKPKNKPTWPRIKAWREKGIHWFSHWHAARQHLRALYNPANRSGYNTIRSYLCVPPDDLNLAGVFVFVGHQPHDVSTVSEIYIPTPATGRPGDIGYRVERPEGALATVSHWQVTLRDPATGDTFQRSCRAISADNAVRKVMAGDVCPNPHLVDVEEISSWEAEILPYEEYDTSDDDQRDDGDDSATVAPIAHFDDPDSLEMPEQFEVRPVVVGQLGTVHA